ncbi:hypothetical protein J2Y58_001165 [Sphingomonas sp. BE138]|uniref:hypothetical protein n=1 Tax=Sphingomonas sp. BE138 TaxID=2817845 RepID=UPI00285EA87A|nr:hypothetical protein [Sphingomonas sp. BE138]MDR6787813.1 hypothetical protein [Sphingomonas sp. BE138]
MAKKKKGKLPKEVLGVKVPKELRKAGEKLIEQAQGPAGRQAIAGALTAVAGAAVTAALSRGVRPAGRTAAQEDHGAEPKDRRAASEAATPGDVIGDMVNAFLSNAGKYNRR